MTIRRAVLLLCCLISTAIWLHTGASAQSQAHRTLTRKDERQETLRWNGESPDPLWSGRGTLSIEANRTAEPIIWATDRDGRAEEIRFSIPEAHYIRLNGPAGSEDGTIVLTGSAYSSEFTGGSFLAVIPPDRGKTTVVRLVPYYPGVAAVASDRSIWIIGYDDQRKQENVLKRFDASGNLLSSKDLNARGSFNGNASSGSTLRASKDRVAWMTNTCEYIEFSLDETEISRLACPPWHPPDPLFTTFAINAKNDVVAAVKQPTRPEPTIWILDRQKRIWSPIDMVGEKLPETARVLGFDGDDLVVDAWAPNRGILTVRLGLSGRD